MWGWLVQRVWEKPAIMSFVWIGLIAEKLKKDVIFDGKNLYDPELVRKAGIECPLRGTL